MSFAIPKELTGEVMAQLMEKSLKLIPKKFSPGESVTIPLSDPNTPELNKIHRRLSRLRYKNETAWRKAYDEYRKSVPYGIITIQIKNFYKIATFHSLLTNGVAGTIHTMATADNLKKFNTRVKLRNTFENLGD